MQQTRESQREELLRQVIRRITDFTTQLPSHNHDRVNIYRTFVFICAERMDSRKGLVYATALQKSINNFLSDTVDTLLLQFAGDDHAEFQKLEADMLVHCAKVIQHMRRVKLLNGDISHTTTAVT